MLLVNGYISVVPSMGGRERERKRGVLASLRWNKYANLPILDPVPIKNEIFFLPFLFVVCFFSVFFLPIKHIEPNFASSRNPVQKNDIYFFFFFDCFVSRKREREEKRANRMGEGLKLIFLLVFTTPLPPAEGDGGKRSLLLARARSSQLDRQRERERERGF